MANKSGKKWTNEEILILIDAYKEESCLYAVSSANYHNRHLRSEVLKRIGDAVRVFKPHVTDKDCVLKFHNLRSQYNIENAKVKMFKKNGTGTDNVYKPSLWYYEHLIFLDTFFIPRKSRNSLEKNKNSEIEESSTCSEVQDRFFSQDSIHIVTDEISEDGHLKVFIEEEFNNESNESRASSEAIEIPSREHILGASTSIQPPCPLPKISPGSLRPSTSISPAMSSSSEMSTECPPPSRFKAQKKCKTTSGDAYSKAVQSLADSLRQPIMIANTPSNNSPSNC